MATQFTRTPEHRFQKRVISDLHFRLQVDLTYQRYGLEDLVNLLTDRHGRAPTDIELSAAIALAESITDYQFFPNDNQLIAELFDEASLCTDLLCNRPWKLLRSRRDHFLTTDRPVTPWRRRTPGNRHRGTGIANAEVIYFPLDPRRVIAIESGDSPAWLVRNASAADIARINERVAHWSTRYVYHRPNHRIMDRIALTPEGPLLHINGIPVREDTDIWSRIRSNYIEGKSAPAIHMGFGVDIQTEHG